MRCWFRTNIFYVWPRAPGFGKVSYPDQSFLAAWMLGCSDAWMPGCLDDSWMRGCLATRMRGCSVAWLTGCLDARMLGYLDAWMLELATRMLGCVDDWMLGCADTGVGCPDDWMTWLFLCNAAPHYFRRRFLGGRRFVFGVFSSIWGL